MEWYHLEVKEVLERLKTSEEGLGPEEAKGRLQEFGPNRIAEEVRISRLKIAFHQFTSPLIYVLLAVSAITISFEEYIDTGVILATVVLNGLIGYLQEYKAEQSVMSLKKMVVPKARAVRKGIEKEIDSVELVPGDVVMLASGSRVPADLRLVSALELKIDEALLTGESVPAEKHTSAIREGGLTPGDMTNMAFMGTAVVTGRAKGVVVETGSKTILGSIAEEVREITGVRAPIQDKISSFAKSISLVVLAASIALFAIGILAGESPKDMFMTAVAAAVATIPEGLPIVVTITMAIGVSRMARRNAIIRKLPAVETLGSTTVIGSDKTGTLTKNEMTVKLLYDGRHVYEVTGSGYEPQGKILRDELEVDLKELHHLQNLLRIGLLCNESGLYQENGRFKVDGDPTEGALIVSAIKGGLEPEQEKDHYRQLAVIPFESERGYMATLHSHRGKKVIFVKGAPEKVLDMCTGVRKKDVHEIAERFARDGLRVLALAYKEATHDFEGLSHKDIESGLAFAGLQGMIDPPRPEAMEAIEGCKRAGIRVVMITGDHAVTALAIADKLGIGSVASKVLTGRDIGEMEDSDLFERVKTVSVYARVAPQHKLRITEQLAKHGDIVAITGDGVNDAPALKAAHIGISMGRSGTDVAKEASDMVLADDNFATIFAAVEEGRVVFDNIRKVVFFLIPTGVAAILSIIGTIILGVPIPYVPAQLLWINIVTNGLQDVALAFEPKEKDVLQRPPRPKGEGIMSNVLIQRTVLVGTLISAGVVYNFVTALDEGMTLEKARTIAVTTMVFFQFFQAWNSRSEARSVFTIPLLSNPFLFYSMIAAFFAQLAVIHVPSLQWIFRTEPLSGGDWLRIGLVSSSVVLLVEADKYIRRRLNRR